MIKVYFKQVYETINEDWILILYDLSANHYVGVTVLEENTGNYIFCKSINKFIDPNSVGDYSKTHIKKCVYIGGQVLSVSLEDFNLVLKKCKVSLINYLNHRVLNDVDGLNYIKWCRDKYNLNCLEMDLSMIKQNTICWVNFGVGVGSELRKLRPAILWRSSSDKRMWTVIPLTTKKRNDKYIFHYDLECLERGTAKIENMMNLSYKRILSPYFINGKLAIITKKDYEGIKKAISSYYLFNNLE